MGNDGLQLSDLAGIALLDGARLLQVFRILRFQCLKLGTLALYDCQVRLQLLGYHL